jgi:hypothetical protein
MNGSPQICADRREPRFRLTETTPAVLTFQNGRRITGELHVISRNGGLLLLPETAHQGCLAELMFHTDQGPVFGTAEMLVPLTCTQQPFRFLTLPEPDQQLLHAACQSGRFRNTDLEERIEELRAAVANTLTQWHQASRWRFVAKLVLALGAVTGFVVCGLYLHLY